MSKSNLNGKTVFLTGATGGIGESIAHKLASLGCNLVLTSTDENRLSDLTNSLGSYDVNSDYFCADLRNISEIYEAIDYVKINYGRVDILINSAGIFPNSTLSESSDKLFYETLDINFRSIFIFSREFSKAMIDNRWGRIVNIGSASSYSGYNETSLYCASKHAVLGFSRSIHEELKDKNVRTFCISPSSTKSKMGLNTKGQDYSTFLEPEDVAEYVAFAISFESNIVTNEIFLKRMILR